MHFSAFIPILSLSISSTNLIFPYYEFCMENIAIRQSDQCGHGFKEIGLVLPFLYTSFPYYSSLFIWNEVMAIRQINQCRFRLIINQYFIYLYQSYKSYLNSLGPDLGLYTENKSRRNGNYLQK